MLKIIESIDLKELENFGFIFREKFLYKPIYKDKDFVYISINRETREVNCTGILGRSEKLDCLYDLIKAGIIEKVEDYLEEGNKENNE